MAPFKSSLAKTAKQLLGFRNTADLGLRGAAQSTRYVDPTIIITATGGSTWTTAAPNGPGGETRYYKVHAFTNSASTENFQVTDLNPNPAEVVVEDQVHILMDLAVALVDSLRVVGPLLLPPIR